MFKRARGNGFSFPEPPRPCTRRLPRLLEDGLRKQLKARGDTSRLTAENEQLASRLQEMDKSQMLRNALHELLTEELHQLNISVLNENLLNEEQYAVEELINQGQDAIEIFENLLNEEQSDFEKLINQGQDAVEIFFNGGLPVCENQQLELRVPQPENNNQSQADNGRPHANFMDYNNRV